MLRRASLATLAARCVLGAALGQVPAEPASRATAPSLLGDAFNKLMDNRGHWAYTQTQSVSGLTAKMRRDTVLRVDPSRAYAEQFLPLMIEGEPPTPGKLEEFRAIGERVARERQREERETREHRGDELRISLNFQTVTPDLERATVVSEDARSVTYEVPLRRKGGAGGPDFDLFQVTARVNRQRREFEHATIRQRRPMSVELLARVSDAEIDCDFTPVDPGFPAVITKETQKATVRILFVKRALGFEMRRGDFRRVTPYDERFGVKLGPIRTLEF
jgi:hypothetical protein